MNFYSWYVDQFWRFVFVQKEVSKTAESFIAYPPMQKVRLQHGSCEGSDPAKDQPPQQVVEAFLHLNILHLNNL